MDRLRLGTINYFAAAAPTPSSWPPGNKCNGHERGGLPIACNRSKWKWAWLLGTGQDKRENRGPDNYQTKRSGLDRLTAWGYQGGQWDQGESETWEEDPALCRCSAGQASLSQMGRMTETAGRKNQKNNQKGVEEKREAQVLAMPSS